MAKAEKCPVCGGTGKVPAPAEATSIVSVTCHGCYGRGWITMPEGRIGKEATVSKRNWEDDKALCEAATPGPWKNVGPVCRRNIQEHLHLVWQIVSCNADGSICIVSLPDEDVTPAIKTACAAKARFLAAAREALPYWLERVRELEEALRDCLKWFDSDEVRTAFDTQAMMAVTHSHLAAPCSDDFCEWAEGVWRRVRAVLGLSAKQAGREGE